MTVHPRARRKRASATLREARQIRSQITSDKHALAAGRITCKSVLKDPESCSLGRMQVFAFLRCVPHLGDKGAKKVLLLVQVWPLDRVRDLSDSERDDILKHLPRRVR